MSTEEQKEKTAEDAADAPQADDAAVRGDAGASIEKAGGSGEAEAEQASTSDDADEDAVAPVQLGFRRFVYAAYFAGAIAVAFLLSKAGTVGWQRLQAWKPETVGEPKEEIVMAISGVIGAIAAYYYWKKPETRKYAEEVASELSQVTWPSRTEVTNGTFVVIVATAFSTIFFALMDRFWGFLTNLVYGAA